MERGGTGGLGGEVLAAGVRWGAEGRGRGGRERKWGGTEDVYDGEDEAGEHWDGWGCCCGTVIGGEMRRSRLARM